jgi:SAM-dependent methyltransferase
MLKSPGSGIKLHLGCFDQPVEGWHNTDITPHIRVSRIPLMPRLLELVGRISPERVAQHRAGIFRKVKYLNVLKRFPFDDNSVECVFSSHMIEHLRADQARFMLRETLRVLKPGGICRMVAPDVEWAVSLFDAASPGAFLQAMYQDDEDGAKNRHQWMYSGQSLCDTMRECGFTNVRQCGFREGRLPDLARMDNRPENSIYVEGEKP